MNHKFTLCCNRGHIFRPGKHFLMIDRWMLPPDNTSVLILCHGIMSEQEYRQFMSQERIMVFQNLSYHWVGLYSFHETKRYLDDQYIGDLVRISEKVWGGYLNVR